MGTYVELFDEVGQTFEAKLLTLTRLLKRLTILGS
jgi:hypothetical protein